MRALPVVVALLGFASAAIAQEPAAAPAPTEAVPSTEALHDELRKLRDDVLAAIGRSDFDAVLPHFHPQAVFTPMNNQVCRGPEEIRAYFDKMTKGPDAVVKSIRIDVEVDRLTDLYGDTGVAFGTANNHYMLTRGVEFSVRTRWTCSLVRENGRWLITAFHSSADVFDNPILEQEKQAVKLKWSGIALVAGALIGALLGVAIGRRRRA